MSAVNAPASASRSSIPLRGAAGGPGTPGGASSSSPAAAAMSSPSPASRLRPRVSAAALGLPPSTLGTAPPPTSSPSSSMPASPATTTPVVPPRSAARDAAGPISPTATGTTGPATSATPAKPPPTSATPRTRKMSIPRLSASSSAASASPASTSSPLAVPAVPPLPSPTTLGSSATPRRSRVSGNLGLEPKTPKAQISRARAARSSSAASALASPSALALGTPSRVTRRQGSLPAETHAGEETTEQQQNLRSPPFAAVREVDDRSERPGENGAHGNGNGSRRGSGNGSGNGSAHSSGHSSLVGSGSGSGSGTHGQRDGHQDDGGQARTRPVDDDPQTLSGPATAPKSSTAVELELQRARDQVRELDKQYRLLQAEHSRCNPRLERPMRALANRQEGSAGMEDKLVALLLDRDTLGTVVRSLGKDQRMGLLGVIAEACKPSDIQAQIDLLEKYKDMRTGVLPRLDDALCVRVLHFLGRQDLLRLRLVSKRYDRLATSPRVWKPLCRELEARWDGTITLTNYHLDDDGDWLGLFKSLWQREKHWTNGQAQSLALLTGHKNYVTSLKLCGETLISASYDDTIRIWHLPYVISSTSSVPPPTVVPARSVSSLDYYAPEGVLVTGSHDIGRASVWRQIDGEWKVERILSGHLHGTRAVAINAQWLVSVGSDKAIVVWDWRTGTKIVRFGQQTNVCIGMNLLDNFIITATVDGVIRTFSIAKREMLGQFKLSDMAARHPEIADKLKEVGVGALGMLTWFAAEGRFLACATKDIVIRLAWDWADPEEQAELAEGIDSPTKSGFFEPGVASPLSPATRARPSLGALSGLAHSPASHSPRPSSPRSPRTSGSGHATPSRVPPSMAATLGKAATGTASAPSATAESEDAPPTTTNTTSRFALGRWPMVVEVLDITGTERGAFEAGRVRIVTSRRLSSRAGAERRVLVGTEHASPDGSKMNMQLVPLGGMWDTLGRQAGLHGASKNPMSLTLDHDKLVYGCSDGSIVVAGFVATQSRQRQQRKPSRSPQPAA